MRTSTPRRITRVAVTIGLLGMIGGIVLTGVGNEARATARVVSAGANVDPDFQPVAASTARVVDLADEISPSSQPAPATCAAGKPSRQAPAYGWPLKPFHRQHPVRGYFGDPRIAPTEEGLLRSFPFRGRCHGARRNAGVRDHLGTSSDPGLAPRHGDDPCFGRNRVRVLAPRRGRSLGRLRDRVPNADRAHREAMGARPLRRAPERRVPQPPSTGRDGPLRGRDVSCDPGGPDSSTRASNSETGTCTGRPTSS